MQRIMGFGDDALYKFTFYLLTSLASNLPDETELSPWSWNQSGVRSANARFMFDRSPFGGSLVTLTLFCSTDTGNVFAGIELKNRRKSKWIAPGFSAMDFTISSIDNIHDAAK